jgi:uncharacterized protein YdaU (DUF1376 family)
MPLYIGDYMADTMRLSTLEHGAYLLLIMEYWRQGPLPDDDRALASIAKLDTRAWSKTVGPVIRRYFTSRDGLLHHKRIEAERAKTATISEKRSNAAKTRYKGGGKTDANAPAKPAANCLHLQEHLQEQKHLQKDSKSIHTRVVARQSQSQSQKKELASSGTSTQAARDQPAATPPRVGDPPERWAALAEGWERDRAGVSRPCLGGEYLDLLAGRLLGVARIDPATFRNDWKPLVGWLKAGISGDRIACAMEAVANRPGYTPKASLAYFDAAVRECRAA